MTVKRISGGKWGACAGQACIGIDYVLVQRKLAPVLVLDHVLFVNFLWNYWIYLTETLLYIFQVELLQKCIKTFYGENIKNLNSICKIVNKNHFERVCNLLEDPGVAASIVYGGSFDKQNL